MFDRILDWVDKGWHHLKPFVVVDAWETVGILRLGRFHKTAKPGFHWKIPFVDDVIEITSCVTTVRLPAQYLTTKDDVSIALAAIIKYEIKDIQPYITGIFDQHDVLCDVTMGAIRRRVQETNYQTLVENPPEKQVATDVRREANRYGFEIHYVTFTSLTKARPIMLIQQSVLANLDN
jgi:regulator of protease activity HflC (stomatin/prohibitin superfamily)